MTDTGSHDQIKDALLDAALPHVVFDGWGAATFAAAVADSGVDPTVADAICPRGAVDLALAFHTRGDEAMRAELRRVDLSAMRFRDKVAFAIRTRLEQVADDKDAVRRGTTLFALPQYAPDGARAIWDTADAIWDTLGDPSDDLNWYTKRATLSGVYAATVLFWLGDTSDGHADTWAFVDRRIEDVMRIEGVKSTIRKNPVLKRVFAGPLWLETRIKAPLKYPKVDLPGAFSANPDT